MRSPHWLGLFALLATTAAPATAQMTYTWQPTTSGNWNTAANWLDQNSAAGVPVSANTTTLAFGGTTAYTATNNIGAFTLNALNFSGSGAKILAGADVLTFAGTAPAISLATDSGAVTISSPVTFGTSGTITNDSGSLFTLGTGAVSLGTTSLTVGGGGNTTISGIISGTATNAITKTGAGTLTLGTGNTYTGTTVINGGRVVVTSATSLGAATADVTINGGTLQLNSGMGTVNSANRTVTVGAAGATFDFGVNQTFEGNGFTGTGTVTKTGAGVWSVGSNASTFSGAIVVNAGGLRLTSPQLNSVNGITINAGATFEINDDITDTFSLAATTRFILNGTGLGGNGAFRLTDQDQTGTGTGNDPITTVNREVNLATNSRVQVENGSAAGSLSQLVFGSPVTGSGGLEKTGTGTLVLTQANTFTGGTTVSAGSLMTTNVDALSTGSLTVGSGAAYGGTYASGGRAFLRVSTTGTATVATNIDISSTAGFYNIMKANQGASQTGTNTVGTNLTLSGTISGGGTGVVLQLDSPTSGDSTTNFTLSGNNTFAGQVRLNRGYLTLANANALGTASLFLQTNANATNGNLNFSGFTTLASNVIIGTSTNQWINTGVENITLAGVLSSVTSGSGGFSKMGTGTLTLTGANTYNGSATVVADGTLAVTGSGRLNSGAYTGTLALTAATSLLDYGSSADQPLSGIISGNGRIVKSGTSVLTLGGNNTYTGTTNVNAGTLLVNANSSAATGAITVANTATLGGTGGTLGGATTVQSGGTLRGGTATTTGTLNTQNVTVEAGGKLAANLAASGTNSTLVIGASTLNLASNSVLQLAAVTGFTNATPGSYTLATLTGNTLQLNGATTTDGQVFGTYVQGTGASGAVVIDASAFTGGTLATGDTFTLTRTGNNLVLNFAPVPEPATVLAVGAAGLGLAGWVRRRRKTATA